MRRYSSFHFVSIFASHSIFKLAQGEYVAPEKLESVFNQHPLVAQVFVHGDSLQSTLVAIIVVGEAPLKNHAESLLPHLKHLTPQELVRSDEVKKDLLKSLQAFGKAHDLKGFENIKNIFLESEPFSLENDLLVRFNVETS